MSRSPNFVFHSFVFQPYTDNSFETETNMNRKWKQIHANCWLESWSGLVIIFRKVPEESFPRNLIYNVPIFAFLLFTTSQLITNQCLYACDIYVPLLKKLSNLNWNHLCRKLNNAHLQLSVFSISFFKQLFRSKFQDSCKFIFVERITPVKYNVIACYWDT